MTTGNRPRKELRRWYRVGKLYCGFVPQVGLWKRVYTEHGARVIKHDSHILIIGTRTEYILWNEHVDRHKHDEKLG